MFNFNFDYSNEATYQLSKAGELLLIGEYEKALNAANHAKQLFEYALEENSKDAVQLHPEMEKIEATNELTRRQVKELIKIHINNCDKYIYLCNTHLRNESLKAQLAELKAKYPLQIEEEEEYIEYAPIQTAESLGQFILNLTTTALIAIAVLFGSFTLAHFWAIQQPSTQIEYPEY